MRRRLLGGVLVAVTAVVVAGCTAGSGDGTVATTGLVTTLESMPDSPAPGMPSTGDVTGATARSSAGAPEAVTLPTTINAGGPILDIGDGYELLARSPAAVARIEFARGRVTVKPAPGIRSGAGAYFIAGSHAVIARAWDYVPGFLMPDHGPAQQLPGALAGGGGQTLPGPEAGQVWIEETTNGAESGVRALHLVGFNGEQTATSIRVDGPPLGSDGSGYILVRESDGIYDVRPEGRTRIVAGDGDVVAVGPTGWVIRPCSGDVGCDDVYVNRTDGSQHPVRFHVESRRPGVISPDGSYAAVIVSNTGDDGASELHVVDVTTGTDKVIELPSGSIFTQPARGAAMTWSPDGRWLFVAAAHIVAVDSATWHAQTLPDLPKDLEFFQVAIRPAP